MTEAVQFTRYRCGVCESSYSTETEASICEARPVTHDRKVAIGDFVTVTGGDGAGKRARVSSVSIIDKDWGHYRWERYWHTVALTADFDDWGSRMLTFDSYEVRP